MDVSPIWSWKRLPRGWKWERFTVVNAGNGQIALHNKVHNRFIRMRNNGRMDASARRAASQLPRGWTWERLTVVRYGCRRVRKRRPRPRPRRPRRKRPVRRIRWRPGRLLPGCVALHNKVHNRFVRMNNKRDMDVSPRKAWNRMPRGWNWERFRIVKAGNGQIALHSRVHNRFIRMTKSGRMVATLRRAASKL